MEEAVSMYSSMVANTLKIRHVNTIQNLYTNSRERERNGEINFFLFSDLIVKIFIFYLVSLRSICNKSLTLELS